MQKKTIAFSVGVHAAVAALAILVAKEHARAPTNVEIIWSSPSKPTPPAPVAAPVPVQAPAVAATTAPRPRTAARTQSARPVVAANRGPTGTGGGGGAVEIGLTLSNTDGPGIDIGPPAGDDGPEVAPAPPPAEAPPVRRALLVAPEPARPAECSEPETKPEPLAREIAIAYTAEARAARAEGRLVVRVAVAPDGSVGSATLESRVHPSIDAAALAALKSWRFRPASRCGKAIAGTYVVARRFELGD